MKQNFYDIETDGITQGLLGKFLECRQLTRWYLMGWSAKGTSMALTYGSIIHAILEGIYSGIQRGTMNGLPNAIGIKRYSQAVEKEWHKENRNPSRETLQHLELSLLIAEATMPIYFEYWHKDFKELAWQKLEQEFSIPYTLPDGRKTILRGKMDGVYGKRDLWLFETKTKSYIQEADLADMLPFELQVNFYLWALNHLLQKLPSGVLYNIIRRIGLRQGAKESITQFSKRCVEDIRKRPNEYFIRMEVSISKQDLIRFDAELKDLVKDFYDWWQGKCGHYKNTGQCINKYGRCKYLTACATNKMSSYEKRSTVFRELEEI